MPNVFTSIAISPSGSTLLNALQVTTSAGTVLNEAVTEVDASNPANVGSVLASGARLVEPGGVNSQPVTGTFFPPTQTITGNVTIIAPLGQATMAASIPVVVASNQTTFPVTVTFPATQTVTGTVTLPSDGSLAATAPLQADFSGLRAATTYPTAVTDGQLVGSMADKAGRPAVVLNAPRDLIGVLTNTAFTATGSTGVLTAAASSFYDISTFIVTNPMTTAAAITLGDGTNSYLFNLAPSGGIAENPATPFPMATAAATWVANLSAAGTVSVIMLYIKNK